jgi:hypothetical protein
LPGFAVESTVSWNRTNLVVALVAEYDAVSHVALLLAV